VVVVLADSIVDQVSKVLMVLGAVVVVDLVGHPAEIALVEEVVMVQLSLVTLQTHNSSVVVQFQT
jgi:hypothetical protein